MTMPAAGLHLRPATLDDVPRLKELGVLGWETTYHDYVSPENRAAYLAGPFWSLERLAAVVDDPASLTLVATTGAEPAAGFLTIEPVETSVVELTRLYVDPALRGLGAGAALFDAARGWSRDHGARTILVNVFADNTGGRRFYERAGCTLIRLEPTTVGDQTVADAWYECEVLGSR
ncbi:MAG TPA: GNAT family N-acetyltransferase [Thermomicrobiales bacterium]|nr:GNAT family N-acetyltransferase [Thermomicrobiales bacterium]